MGGNRAEIKYRKQLQPETGYSFSIHRFGKSKAIAVGILTSRTDKNEIGIGGNLLLFQELHLYLAKHGIFSFVFTPDDSRNEDFEGYIFSSDLERWIKVSVPVPDVVYNRIPFRSHEISASFRQMRNLLKQYKIPFFNPRFLHKYEIFELFKEDELLEKLLPETILFSSSTALYSFLKTHRTIYVKPVTGNRGSGISIIALKKDETLEVLTLTAQKQYKSFSHFWEQESVKFGSKPYIIQKAITPKKIDGHRYDYRVLVHYEKGSYELSGKAVRMSQSQEITTHIPKGGMLYPYEKVRSEALDDLLMKVAERCGKILRDAFGFFGEFSIDLGEDESGKLYLFEVNSKPMHFDEEEIEAQRRSKLKNLFIELALAPR